MNTIKKQKGALISFGILSFILAILSSVFGVILTIKGASTVSEGAGIVKLVFGIILIIAFIPLVIFAIKATFVGFSLTATEGSIKQGNIAKQGGTVNMKKCDKCGTELKDGETECSNCGKKIEDIKK